MTDFPLPVDMNGASLPIGAAFIFVFDGRYAYSYRIREIVEFTNMHFDTNPAVLHRRLHISGMKPPFHDTSARVELKNSFTLLAKDALLIPDNIVALGLPSILAFIKLSGVEVEEDAE